jgi:hypothetical protein
VLHHTYSISFLIGKRVGLTFARHKEASVTYIG